MTTFEVAVVGGSFAGLQAAMILGRQLVPVAVFDTNLPRNRHAHGVHNVLALDGVKPSVVLDTMRKQTLAYSSVSLKQSRVVKIVDITSEQEGADPLFEVYSQPIDAKLEEGTKGNGSTMILARRLVLAYGVSDTLPPISNIYDFWGVGIAHCPHCHGYEVKDQKLAVLKNTTMPGCMMQLGLLKELTSQPVYFFTNGAGLDESEKKLVAESRNVVLVETVIVSFVGDKSARSISAVELIDTRTIPMDCVFVMPQTAPIGDLHVQLNLKTENGMTGPFITNDAQRMTSLKGVYVAGDIGTPVHQVNFATSAGSMAGLQCHISLLMAKIASEKAKASAS